MKYANAKANRDPSGLVTAFTVEVPIPFTDAAGKPLPDVYHEGERIAPPTKSVEVPFTDYAALFFALYKIKLTPETYAPKERAVLEACLDKLPTVKK